MKLRTKTANAIKEAGADISLIESKIQAFTRKEEIYASRILLDLLCSDAFTLERCKKDLWLEDIDTDLVKKLRGDLADAYRSCNTSCYLNKDIPQDAKELYKALGSDRTKLNYLLKMIKELDLHTDQDRILFLLQSDLENQVFGGIRSLGISKSRAELFTPAAKEIAAYIKTIEYDNRDNTKWKDNSSIMVESVSISKDPTTCDCGKESESSIFSDDVEMLEGSIDPKQILANVELVREFGKAITQLENAKKEYSSIYDKIQAVGISPEALERNSTKINALLFALAQF